MSDDCDVKGVCPMGCGETLFLGSSGYIICSYLYCPNPRAVSDLLEDRETEHIVRMLDDTYTVLHPLKERLGDALMACELAPYVESLPVAARRPGNYRVTRRDGHWIFVRQADK